MCAHHTYVADQINQTSCNIWHVRIGRETDLSLPVSHCTYIIVHREGQTFKRRVTIIKNTFQSGGWLPGKNLFNFSCENMTWGLLLYFQVTCGCVFVGPVQLIWPSPSHTLPRLEDACTQTLTARTAAVMQECWKNPDMHQEAHRLSSYLWLMTAEICLHATTTRLETVASQ